MRVYIPRPAHTSTAGPSWRAHSSSEDHRSSQCSRTARVAASSRAPRADSVSTSEVATSYLMTNAVHTARLQLIVGSGEREHWEGGRCILVPRVPTMPLKARQWGDGTGLRTEQRRSPSAERWRSPRSLQSCSRPAAAQRRTAVLGGRGGATATLPSMKPQLGAGGGRMECWAGCI